MDTKPPETGIIIIRVMRPNLNRFVEASIVEFASWDIFCKLIDFRPNEITEPNINLHRFEASNPGLPYRMRIKIPPPTF